MEKKKNSLPILGFYFHYQHVMISRNDFFFFFFFFQTILKKKQLHCFMSLYVIFATKIKIPLFLVFLYKSY
jgi:hypothetical protein